MTNNKILWIAWEDDGSIRSKILAKKLNAKFCTFTFLEGLKFLSLIRYFAAIIQTILIFLREKPKILFVQNPSIILSFFSALTKNIFNYYLIIDLHTHYINYSSLYGVLLKLLNNFSLNHCNLVIVTNKSYQNKIKNTINNEILVLPDMIPEFDHDFMKIKLKGKKNVLYICTFSDDEPWQEVIKAAKLLQKDIYIYITGKHNNRINTRSLPSNVVLTGFTPNETYQNLLRSVDIIIVLTVVDDCLLCGGYEAIAAEKPLIISDKKVIKDFFSKGAIFTENNSKSIAKAINKAIKYMNILHEEIKSLKLIRNTQWEDQWNFLLMKIKF